MSIYNSEEESMVISDMQTVSEKLTECDTEENEKYAKKFKHLFDFKMNGCWYVRLYGKSCSSVTHWDKLVNYRHQCQEMSKTELDKLIEV